MAEKRLSHAYMLVGPDEPARDARVTQLAAELLCGEANAPCGRCRDCRKVFAGVHPDVIRVERTAGDKGQLRRDILVDQIRRITSDTVIAPNEAARKVYIIREADKLNTAAQNALLKALEEPPAHVCFILCTTAADALLPTVRSRCVREDETVRSTEPAELSDMAREYIQLLASGNVADITLFCMLRGQMAREDADALLDEVISALGDILCRRRPDPGLRAEQIFTQTALLEQGREYLRHNVSPKQVFGVLAAEALR